MGQSPANAPDLYTAVGTALHRANRIEIAATRNPLFSASRKIVSEETVSSAPGDFSKEEPRVRTSLCAALLLAAVACAATVSSQESKPDVQEGAQQSSYQSMTPTQRAEATRAFLGLGAVPDKAAAARGAPLFAQNCGFCHGSTARGATAPSLITSDRVLEDDHAEHLTPFLKKGIPEKGMPAFATLPQQDLTDIAEFLHLQVEDVANRGAYHVLNIVVGNADLGKAYVDRHCMACHTATTFAHIAARFRSPEQLQRHWIWPARSAAITASVKTRQGTKTGRVIQISDFRITLLDATDQTLSILRGPGIEVRITDPLAAHQEMLMTLENDAMHNVTAYLETLK